VVLMSLRAQLKAPASNTRPVSSMCLNLEGSAGSAARCQSLAWVPGSDGTAFVAAHRDSTVLLYHKASERQGCCSMRAPLRACSDRLLQAELSAASPPGRPAL
jgi:hypothetical protein